MYSVIQEAWNIQACKCSAIGLHGARFCPEGSRVFQ